MNLNPASLLPSLLRASVSPSNVISTQYSTGNLPVQQVMAERLREVDDIPTVVNVDCQLDAIWNHHGDKSLRMSVRELVDWVN